MRFEQPFLSSFGEQQALAERHLLYDNGKGADVPYSAAVSGAATSTAKSGTHWMARDDSDQPVTKANLKHALHLFRQELEIENFNEQTKRANAQTKLLKGVLAGLLGFMFITAWTLFLISLKK